MCCVHLQILRWQHKRPHQEAPGTPAGAGQADDAAIQHLQRAVVASIVRRPQLVLTLESSDHLPAALAVLQALYGVKELHVLLSELQQEQQLQVALLADLWQVPQLTSTAVLGLHTQLKIHRHLSEEVTEQLLALQAVPDFLQGLLEAMLLCKFGALEAVWGNPAQAGTLLKASLPVMQVFLSLGGLQVRFFSCAR
jgi:hypothetical protein